MGEWLGQISYLLNASFHFMIRVLEPNDRHFQEISDNR